MRSGAHLAKANGNVLGEQAGLTALETETQQGHCCVSTLPWKMDPSMGKKGAHWPVQSLACRLRWPAMGPMSLSCGSVEFVMLAPVSGEVEILVLGQLLQPSAQVWAPLCSVLYIPVVKDKPCPDELAA